MFAPGTAQTKPEIYAMGFRNPFTIHADPNEPGAVVVGEYGPDAATDSATFGPAGVIEWDRVAGPGFYGWPLCVGDNAVARSYFRYQFPNGPQGARYSCSAAQIPNNSPLEHRPTPRSPARRRPPTSGPRTAAARPPNSGSRASRTSRPPARSTSSIRTTPRRPSGPPTTTAPG